MVVRLDGGQNQIGSGIVVLTAYPVEKNNQQTGKGQQVNEYGVSGSVAGHKTHGIIKSVPTAPTRRPVKMAVISQRISKMTFFTDGVKNVFKCSIWSLKFIVLSPVKDLVKINLL